MKNLEEPRVYAVKHKDLDVRMSSRSGGFFTALSDLVLDAGGVVYGCVLNSDFEAEHVRADSKGVRDSMRGSKYIQSSLGDTFFNVRKDLDDGQLVLFTGTPCQAAGLKSFLNREYEQLILADILCHGVPSTKVWETYLAWQEEKYGKCKDVDFRNKKDFGWAAHVESLTFDDQMISSKVFTTIFYGHHALRPCCFQCPYKSLSRVGDLSLADYWEIDRAYPGFNDDKGVSLIFVNNDKGAKYFEQVKDALDWKQTRLEDSTRPSMLKPFPEPDNRDSFWKDFMGDSFGSVAKKYGGDGTMAKLRKRAGSLKSRIKRK